MKPATSIGFYLKELKDFEDFLEGSYFIFVLSNQTLGNNQA